MGATCSIGFLISVIYIITQKTFLHIITTIMLLCLITCQWWRDISRERAYQGYHTTTIITGIRWGIVLFIISEILFFLSFFWAFFHRRLSPNLEIGSIWPPLGIGSVNPYKIPLLNTTLLLRSGVSITLGHNSIMRNKNNTTTKFFIVTIFLGIYFTTLQIWEYYVRFFSITDSSFGSCFFVATGLHGLHVLVGTLFILIRLIRHKISLYSQNHHINIEISIWYWHFVDVVWLFLFVFIYWWSF